MNEIDIELNEEQMKSLLDFRGGCNCPAGYPPCSNCTNPLTMDEAIDLGFIVEQPAEKKEIKSEKVSMFDRFSERYKC